MRAFRLSALCLGLALTIAAANDVNQLSNYSSAGFSSPSPA